MGQWKGVGVGDSGDNVRDGVGDEGDDVALSVATDLAVGGVTRPGVTIGVGSSPHAAIPNDTDSRTSKVSTLSLIVVLLPPDVLTAPTLYQAGATKPGTDHRGEILRISHGDQVPNPLYPSSGVTCPSVPDATS